MNVCEYTAFLRVKFAIGFLPAAEWSWTWRKQPQRSAKQRVRRLHPPEFAL